MKASNKESDDGINVEKHMFDILPFMGLKSECEIPLFRQQLGLNMDIYPESPDSYDVLKNGRTRLSDYYEADL